MYADRPDRQIRPTRARRARLLFCPAVLVLACVVSNPADCLGGTINFLNTWGTFGLGEGQFDLPASLAVSDAGEVYVADLDNRRIQKFDHAGDFIDEWGENGTGDGQFGDLFGVAVGGAGEVYVADTTNNRIQKFDSSGQFLDAWGTFGTGDSQFDQPTSVTLNGAGEVFVVDSLNNRVQKFDSSGAFLDDWGTNGLGDSQFEMPIGATASTAGEIFVVDTGNNRIQKFDGSGAFLDEWGTSGSGDGQFAGARRAAVSDASYLYVTEKDNNRIQKFDTDGGFQEALGSLGTDVGQFDNPEGIAVSDTGEIYVSDQANNRIQRFFDPDAWVAGTNAFTNPAIGPTDASLGLGQLLGEALLLSPAMHLDVAGATNIQSGATLTLGGGSLTTNSLTGNGTFIYDGGILSVASQTMSVNTIHLNSPFTLTLNALSATDVTVATGVGFNVPAGAVLISGTLTVNPLATLIVGGAANVDATTLFNDGTVVLDGAGALLSGTTVSNDGLIRGDGTINSLVTNNAAGEIRAEAGKTLTLTAASPPNAGLINLQGGTLELAQALQNSSAGDILGRGTLDVGGAGLTNTGDITLTNGPTDLFGDLNNQGTGRVIVSGNADVTFWDDVAHSGAMFNVSTGSSVTFFGDAGFSISGGDVFMEDDVIPGDSPALETFGGNLHLGASANLQIEIEGDAHDQLDVAGAVSLGGTLTVTGLQGLSTPGDATLSIITAGSLTGNFASLPELNDGSGAGHLGHGLFLEGINTNPTSVTLDVYQADPGDANGDRAVTILGDATALVANLDPGLGSQGHAQGEKDWLDADFNHDSIVNIVGDGVILVAALTAPSADTTAPAAARMHYDWLTGQVTFTTSGQTTLLVESLSGKLLTGGDNLTPGTALDQTALPDITAWLNFSTFSDDALDAGFIVQAGTHPSDLIFSYQNLGQEPITGQIIVSNFVDSNITAPEPSSIALAALALLGFLAHSRGRRV